MTITEHLDRLAELQPVPFPVVSLYVNAEPDEHGRDPYDVFARNEFRARLQTYPLRSEERQSLSHDLDRISTFLQTGVRPTVNGVAVFACHRAGLFETLQFEPPVDRPWLYIGDQPHLYPLARAASKSPPYVVVLADTARTRIIVVAADPVAVSKPGALSQTRYERHVEDYDPHHVKDVVNAFERIALDDHVTRVILSGDAAVLLLLHEQTPKWLAQRVVDESSLPADASEREVIATTFRAMRRVDERTDRQKVEAAVDAYRAGALGVVGPAATLQALDNGQVEGLLLTDTPDEIVKKAQLTGASVTLVEDPSLLEPFGGVAATLRHRF